MFTYLEFKAVFSICYKEQVCNESIQAISKYNKQQLLEFLYKIRLFLFNFQSSIPQFQWKFQYDYYYDFINSINNDIFVSSEVDVLALYLLMSNLYSLYDSKQFLWSDIFLYAFDKVKDIDIELVDDDFMKYILYTVFYDIIDVGRRFFEDQSYANNDNMKSCMRQILSITPLIVEQYRQLQQKFDQTIKIREIDILMRMPYDKEDIHR